jgi:hypothetical protein
MQAEKCESKIVSQNASWKCKLKMQVENAR